MAISDADKNIGPVLPAVLAGVTRHVAPDLRVADCTLRDGEQQAGVAFRADEKVRIAEELDALGVYEIEAGTPAASKDDADAISRIVALGLNAKISVLSRPIPAEIEQVSDLGAWGVRLSVPISPIQRAAKLHLSDEEYLDLAVRSTHQAKSLGLEVVFSPYDTTRAELFLLDRLVQTLYEEGTVDRVRIVDTAGCATPEVIRYLVERMHSVAPIPLEVHCHDDLGLATMNTIAGALAGVEYLSVTVNGLGERSGNACLEEVALALEVLYGVELGLKLDRLRALSELVEDLSAVRLQDHKPVVGRGAFAHESGMVVAGVLKDPFTAECYAPHVVGQDRRIVLGKLSGMASVRHALGQLGVSASDEQGERVLEAIKTEAIRTKAGVDDARFSQLVGDILAADGNRRALEEA